uniref:Uncharacterized protein n=1 Tax=Anguilla anguilla TaxID=7936 RepID=A0A0E9V6K1_ANGAN
MSFLLFPWGPV